MLYVTCQIGAPGVAAPPERPMPQRMFKHLRDIAFGLLISISAAAVVYAEAEIQEWIPTVLAIPEDAEVVMDRAIGASVRMFSITTGADVDALLADWEESLNDNGFPVTQSGNDLLDRAIEFSGPGIANAKILVAPSTDEGRNIIEFDATLN
jgi:hypothetical protein